MFSVKPVLLAAVMGALPLAGCNAVDPLLREGDYNLTHANRADLVLMAAYPADLVRGTGETSTPGAQAVAAVDRLYNDKRKPLLSSSLSSIGSLGNGN